MYHLRRALLILSLVLGALSLRADESLVLPLPGSGPDAHSVTVPGTLSFTYPDGPHGQYKHGFRTLNDSTAEWQKYYGVQYEVKLPDSREVALITGIGRIIRNPSTETAVTNSTVISGKGWHTVTLPWSAFAFNQADTAFLKTVKSLTIAAQFADGAGHGKIQVRNARIIQAAQIALESDVCGKSAQRNGDAEYDVTVGNCTGTPQSVSLSFVKYGWEAMTATVDPVSLQLAPGETRVIHVTVYVPDTVPPGGHEEQVLQAIANGDAANVARLKFITTCELPHPYILHTAAAWQEVRDKVTKYDWAKAQQDEIVRHAQNWQVPAIADPAKAPDDTYGPYVFATQNESDLLACAYAWQLTRDTNAAQKVALFLRRLSDPAQGYPVTFRACNQSLVQEGHFFQHIAMSYDMILDSGILSAADRAQIETTFRLFLETISRVTDYGPINNWNLSEDCGAFYCCLAMQDLAAAQRWFAGPSGICDQLSKGVMDDGWWYECSISYNMWCASEFTQVGLAYEPFGVDFLHMKVPAGYSSRVFLTAALSGGVVLGGDPNQASRPFGMNPEIFGPHLKPYRDIKMMWDSLLPFIDYRGIMFGVNDSTENKVSGGRSEIGGSPPFELAYYAFRDPRYVSLVKLGDRRDLIYGVPDLPTNTPENFYDSAYADNVGLAMLRSQTTDRPIREQIQAALHYGTHGWAHGHYDRTDLISLVRYGRSFWNPESVFWVYEPFMYKFYCQTSLNHNLVVVDEKMQESTPGERLLYHTGDALQATVVQTKSRWSNPPYGGMVYDYVPVKTFAEKGWREGRSVPAPTNPPAYGALTGFTEPVLQRRALLVLDDYIVVADYLKGTNTHTFESLLQLKGFQGLDAPDKKFLRHDAQWNSNPVGSGQFVTDCSWYSVSAPALGRFVERFGPGEDNDGSRSTGNEPGLLKLDVHTLWPPQAQIMVATAPEQHDTEKRLFYTVRGDGQSLTNGKFGAWILGSADIDVPVENTKQLELETRVELSKKPTVFWADARVVTKDGKEIPLSRLPVKYENIAQPVAPNEDYFGGPVKIVGNEYKFSVPGQPANDHQSGFVRVDLSGIDAVRFKATLGSDYPLGDESQRRKVYAVRADDGTEARFLTVIEPYETDPVVKSAVADGPDKLRVELIDGRVQEIQLENFTGDGSDIRFHLTETRNGQVIRSEDAKASD